LQLACMDCNLTLAVRVFHCDNPPQPFESKMLPRGIHASREPKAV
jgi:hypothetical protein